MRLDKTTVIAVSNQKGGCGKTTTSVNLSAALAEAGYLVALVDNDEQRNATTGLGLDLAEHLKDGLYTVLDAHIKKRPMDEIVVGFDEQEGRPTREHFVLAPGHRELGAVESFHKREVEDHLRSESASDLDGDDMRRDQRYRLRRSIDSLRGHVDFVLIDCPPNLRYLMTSALIAADAYVVPCLPATFDLGGLGELNQTVAKVRKGYNEHLALLGAILVGSETFKDGRIRNNLDREAYDTLKQHMGAGKVFETVVGPTVKLRESFAFGQTIFEYAPDERVTGHYRALAQELVKRVENLLAPKEPATLPTKLAAPAPSPEVSANA